jgi:tRNA pseudouridine38-40 synthase
VRRVRLTVEYDGAGFRGWQLQPGERTVQGTLDEALRKVVHADVRVIGAGRTDAGVHARGQVAHADVPGGLGPLELRRALNAVLPDDVAVLDLREAAADFHARHDALSKTYRYRVLNRPVASPERRGVSWHIRSRLDLDAMRATAELLRGDHDFAAFRGAHGGAPEGEDTRRTLDRLEVARHDDEVWIETRGRSFLRYMVRNLAGTLVDVGLGRTPPDEVGAILASGDRARAAPTAPPGGLCLLEVGYAPNPKPDPPLGPSSAAA